MDKVKYAAYRDPEEPLGYLVHAEAGYVLACAVPHNEVPEDAPPLDLFTLGVHQVEIGVPQGPNRLNDPASWDSNWPVEDKELPDPPEGTVIVLAKLPAAAVAAELGITVPTGTMADGEEVYHRYSNSFVVAYHLVFPDGTVHTCGPTNREGISRVEEELVTKLPLAICAGRTWMVDYAVHQAA